MAKLVLNPWLEIQNMRDEILRLMDEVESKGEEKSECALWKPKTDIYETEEFFVLEIELPGIAEEKIEVEIKGRELRIYGERRLEKDVCGSEYHLLERSYGPFARKFIVPEYVDTREISAKLQKGILVISLLKKKHISKNIKINIEEG
ncbi:HSP20 family protein [Desulfonauticus submarinus]|uniref:HSP20 family protein n=1 Tax=Desulfonauticus submarinus TaxID=206665 RepID=A0A1H0CKJ3_9BACT|nr:Hsp20/alpha crystallin family protein [Desulfonauticus submarinus]SDN58400.1 HSP20 family protein [Desulfonauticus submarinus]